MGDVEAQLLIKKTKKKNRKVSNVEYCCTCRSCMFLLISLLGITLPLRLSNISLNLIISFNLKQDKLVILYEVMFYAYCKLIETHL